MSSFDSFKIQILNLFKRSEEHKTRVHKFGSLLSNFDWYTPEDPEIETYSFFEVLTKKLEINDFQKETLFSWGTCSWAKYSDQTAEITLKWWWLSKGIPLKINEKIQV